MADKDAKGSEHRNGWVFRTPTVKEVETQEFLRRLWPECTTFHTQVGPIMETPCQALHLENMPEIECPEKKFSFVVNPRKLSEYVFKSQSTKYPAVRYIEAQKWFVSHQIKSRAYLRLSAWIASVSQ